VESSIIPPLQTAAPLPFPLEPRSTTPHVFVVIPVLNEEQVLPLTYGRLKETLEDLHVPWSILFVNDGSVDGSIDVLESLYQSDARVSYISLSRNFGHQAALAAGLDHARGDVVITMDADLQHPPQLIATMLSAWRNGYDVVHTQKIATEELGAVRSRLTSHAYGAIGRVSRTAIIPHASDFRLLDREALLAVRGLPERGRLYRGLTPWIGFRQAVVSYRASVRAAGTSKYRFRQLADLFSRSFFDFSRAPLQVGLLAGAAAIALCMAYAAFVAGALVLGYDVPRGFASLLFAIVFLGSVNLTFAGILGVYMARIYDEVRGRPTYVVGRIRARPADSEALAVPLALDDALDEQLQPLRRTGRS
jgi:polyisoprenyl-phosphate glycosyltransferase